MDARQPLTKISIVLTVISILLTIVSWKLGLFVLVYVGVFLIGAIVGAYVIMYIAPYSVLTMIYDGEAFHRRLAFLVEEHVAHSPEGARWESCSQFARCSIVKLTPSDRRNLLSALLRESDDR